MARRIKLPRIKTNPYAEWDNGISPKWLLFNMFGEPISNTTDERRYSNSALRLLEREGRLIEEYLQIEQDLKRRAEDDDDIPRSFYSQDSTLYLFGNNVISVKRGSDDTMTLDSYYPVSGKSALSRFSRYLVKEVGESRVSVLTSRNGGLVANKVSFGAPEIPDVELNYGTGFKKTYETIIEKLKSNKAGLFLFHGDPGTGKSYLLKHLTAVVDREFIFVPVALVPRLSDPDLITLLLGKKSAVLILEDAEQAIQKRGQGGDDATVSSLLNLTDGILGNVLGLTIIASYNIDSSQIDKALTRKGRLLYEHSFGPLRIEDAQRLAKHLDKKLDIKTPMTLADIYGVDDQTNHPTEPAPQKEMGFHTLIATPKSDQVGEKIAAREKD